MFIFRDNIVCWKLISSIKFGLNVRNIWQSFSKLLELQSPKKKPTSFLRFSGYCCPKPLFFKFMHLSSSPKISTFCFFRSSTLRIFHFRFHIFYLSFISFLKCLLGLFYWLFNLCDLGLVVSLLWVWSRIWNFRVRSLFCWNCWETYVDQSQFGLLFRLWKAFT